MDICMYTRVIPPRVNTIYKQAINLLQFVLGVFLCSLCFLLKVGITTCEWFSTNLNLIKIQHLCICRCGWGVVSLTCLGLVSISINLTRISYKAVALSNSIDTERREGVFFRTYLKIKYTPYKLCFVLGMSIHFLSISSQASRYGR